MEGLGFKGLGSKGVEMCGNFKMTCCRKAPEESSSPIALCSRDLRV